MGSLEKLEARIEALERAVYLQSVKTPQTLELEIEWPEADIGGLHFNFQRTKGVFELKEDGRYHSRNALFMSARNIEGDNSQDTLSEYLESDTVNEAFCRALKEAGIINGGDNDIEISPPKENEGVKKYNGTECWYWLLSPYAGISDTFCIVNADGTADIANAGTTGGVSLCFRLC